VCYVQVYAHLQPESFTYMLGVNMLLMVVFGGAGTVIGPLVGAVFVMWLQQSDAIASVAQFQQDHISEHWYLSPTGLIGLLLIATLFILPKGVAGTIGAVWRGRAARRAEAERESAVETEAEPTSVVMAAAPAPPPAPAPTGTPLLSVRGLEKRFGGLQAVGGVDLDVTAGGVHAIIGPNGAGKSTLANLITGVYRVDGGTVTLDGADITGWPAHRASRGGIARTFQTPQLFLDQTVIENVKAGFQDTAQLSLWRAAVKTPGQYRRAIELDAETHALLRRVGLDDVAHRPAMELSYGQQRTVEIARALAGNPSLLILDEPAAGLNPTETMRLGELLNELCREGLGMIMVEHHMDLVTSVAAEVTCMHQGQVLAHGDVASVLSDEAVVAAYLGHTVDSVAELEASR
ncbi:MAG TPA: ATP-binding cassette domain-containing protein, partial [Baekduia sp.]